MSNHFTYEIDERNLRSQLKAYTVPTNENAWQKLEAHIETSRNSQHENKFGNFNLTLNRNIVLPSVFGIIIIIFSFLLVNFVSIKNPVKEKKQKTNITNTTVPEEPKQEVEKTTLPAITQPKVETPQIEKLTTNTPESESVKPLSATTKVEPVKEEKTPSSSTEEPKKEKKIVLATSTISSTESTVDTIAANLAEEEAKAKRKAKKRAEAIETQKLLEIRPTPVSEERDSEIRPN